MSAALARSCTVLVVPDPLIDCILEDKDTTAPAGLVEAARAKREAAAAV